MSFGQGEKQNRAIVRKADVQAGQKVLDVGCGTGAQTLPAAAVAGPGNVSGIDASPDMIEIARRKAKKRRLDVDFRVAPMEDLPFENNQFDLALSGFMLHHLPDDVKLQGLQEVRRVLKPGGQFVAVDFSAEGGSLMGRVITLFGHGHSKRATVRLREMLEEAGFQRVETLDSGQPGTVFIRAS
jgi:demethylmenaquinone methyltransferase/2-methoxy-6-polyprenyl-1,4-benzoquinol methylase/phosphoethanolamine N-methyltransferase